MKTDFFVCFFFQFPHGSHEESELRLRKKKKEGRSPTVGANMDANP